MAESDGWCVHCKRKGIQTIATCVDHEVPAWVEGVDFYDKAALVVSCARCNRVKVASDAKKYRRGAPKPTPFVMA